MKPEDKITFQKLTDAQLLALCIYGEARGESYEGRRAVGSVILNRKDKGGWYGKTVKAVILKPYQFSCFLEADKNFKRLLQIAYDFRSAYDNDIALRGCFDVAAALVDGDVKRNTKATHYKTVDCKAKWADKMQLVNEIGAHQFYMEA